LLFISYCEFTCISSTVRTIGPFNHRLWWWMRFVRPTCQSCHYFQMLCK